MRTRRSLFVGVVVPCIAGCTVELSEQGGEVRTGDAEALRAAYESPVVEFKAEIANTSRELFELYVSVPKNRYRLEGRTFVVLGDLDDRETMVVLDPDAGTHVVRSPDAYAQLRGDRAAQERYRQVTHAQRAIEALGLAKFALASPCARAEEALGVHGSCEVRLADGDREHWTHRATSRSSLYDGFKKRTFTTEHEFDRRNGLLLDQRVTSPDGEGRGPTLRSVVVTPLDAALFEPPADSVEQTVARTGFDRR